MAWSIDTAHTSVGFVARHLGLSKVRGQFGSFRGEVEGDPNDLTTAKGWFEVDMSSIDSGNADRDAHLKSADFFDVEKFPTITFKSTSVVPRSKETFDVTGELTMHGVTKKVTLPVTFLGFMKHPRGEKAGFEIETTLNRKDYGIVWNRALDEGGFMLSDDVKVSINLEVDRKIAPPAPAPAATK